MSEAGYSYTFLATNHGLDMGVMKRIATHTATKQFKSDYPDIQKFDIITGIEYERSMEDPTLDRVMVKVRFTYDS